MAEDRIEAMRGVWGALAYLMRGETEKGGGGDNDDDGGKDEGNGENKGENKKEGDTKGDGQGETKFGSKEVVMMDLGGG